MSKRFFFQVAIKKDGSVEENNITVPRLCVYADSLPAAFKQVPTHHVFRDRDFQDTKWIKIDFLEVLG